MRTPRRLLTALALVLLAGCGAGDPAATPTAAPPAGTAAPSPTDAAQPTAAPTPTAAPGSEPATSGLPSPGASHDGVVTLAGPDGTELSFQVEVAADPQTRRRGLMERTELPQDAGMLFLFPDETQGGFWMKNTLIPLDIAFLADDGAVVEVLRMQPCQADPCEVYTPDGFYVAALEVDAGALDAVDETWQARLPTDLPEPQ